MVVQFVAFLGAYHHPDPLTFLDRRRGRGDRHLAVYLAVHTLFATTHAWRWGRLRVERPEPASLRPVLGP